MKNSLELELQLKIKRANRFLTAKQYPEAINQYTEGLKLYHENRTYNTSVSEQFEALLYSLRGNTYSLNLDSELAEEDFTKSLSINPYSAVTLSRRAKHFMKEKRFSEAIQDIDLALLYDPENLSYISLLNSIQNYVNEMSDEIEKQHISSLVSDVKNRLQAKPPTESESDEEDDEALLNFSKLKQIDRKSVRIFGKLENRKSVIQFKEDTILEYVTDDNKDEPSTSQEFQIRVSVAQIDQKLKQQDEQLEKLEAEEDEIRKTEPLRASQQLILTKSHEKSRKSILRRSSINAKEDNFVFLSSPGEKSGFLRKSSISVASIKDIDGKIVKHQADKIKFRPSISQVSKFDLGDSQQIPEENQKENFLSKTTPKLQKRKSCLRSSNRFMAEDLQELSKTAPVIKKTSNFMNIRSIDGGYKKKKQQPKSEDEWENGVIEVKIESQSDDDDDEHNIFGEKKDKEVIEAIEHMEEIPEIITKNLSNKKSILRKDSLLGGSLAGSMLGWTTEKKKSVLFKTG